MSDYFETFTQYDNKYNELVKLGYTNSSCSTFAILTAYNFMNNPNNISKKIHEKCVNLGVINYLYSEIEGMMSFDEMLQFTKLDKKEVMATSVELVVSDIIGFNQMIKISDKPYCIIFLKNAKFFVVMINKDKYCVRDCHESIQYNYTKREDLINHLVKVYNFCEPINIDGYSSKELDEFNNIEFLTIDNKFEMTLDETLYIEGITDNLIDENEFMIDELNNIEKNNIIIEL
jgi:hypothetical protein